MVALTYIPKLHQLGRAFGRTDGRVEVGRCCCCCCCLSGAKCKRRGRYPCRVTLMDLLMEISTASAPPSPWWEMVQEANPGGSCSLSCLLLLGNFPSQMAQRSCQPGKRREQKSWAKGHASELAWVVRSSLSLKRRCFPVAGQT